MNPSIGCLRPRLFGFLLQHFEVQTHAFLFSEVGHRHHKTQQFGRNHCLVRPSALFPDQRTETHVSLSGLSCKGPQLGIATLHPQRYNAQLRTGLYVHDHKFP